MPPAFADVTSLKTDKQFYDKDESIVFSGTAEDGGEIITLIIRSPTGGKVDLKNGLASSSGLYEIVPIKIKDIFSAVGVYKALAFTSDEKIANATSINLQFDGTAVRVGQIYDLRLVPIGDKQVNEGSTLTFTARITDSSIAGEYELGTNAPAGAKIDSRTGEFTWTPDEEFGSGAYLVDIVVRAGASHDSKTITVTVNKVQNQAVQDSEPKASEVKAAERESKERESAERESKEVESKEVESAEPSLASFVDSAKDPQHYVDRYLDEDTYKKWFDENFPQYDSIYEAVGLSEPVAEVCAQGTVLKDGVCSPVEDKEEVVQPKTNATSDSKPLAKQDDTQSETNPRNSGCLIATAAYGSEMAVQVQLLREIRDDVVLQTRSGSAFIDGFNQFYYSFSPTVADWERNNPAFKETVKVVIAPMLATLEILNHADIDTEYEMIGYGLGIIALNAGMYLAAPAIIMYMIFKRWGRANPDVPGNRVSKIHA